MALAGGYRIYALLRLNFMCNLYQKLFVKKRSYYYANNVITEQLLLLTPGHIGVLGYPLALKFSNYSYIFLILNHGS